MDERENIWSEFLARWPLEALPSMTLEDYAQAGNPDTFSNWIEARTESLGSIWGGSAFKFGVYGRKDKSAKPDGRGKHYNSEYGWMSKYGNSPQAAFERVKAEIVKVAQASRAGKLEEVDSADLGQVIRWKIAFLYQDRSSPKALPLLDGAFLRAALDSSEKRASVMQAQLMGEIGDRALLDYYDQVLSRAQSRMRTELTPDATLSFLEARDGYHPVKAATKKMAGFQSKDERQLALALDNARTTIYLEAGDWPTNVVDDDLEITSYGKDKSRSSNLQANAPRLAVGNAIVKVVVPTMELLTRLLDAYDGADETNPAEKEVRMPANDSSEGSPLNQILFGPPGTGKTFATVESALSILDPSLLKELGAEPLNDPDWARDRRQQLKARFDQLVDDRRVRFVTFHQSFSYEDFVEGLRAQTTPEKTIEYVVQDGVFKELCDAARILVSRQHEDAISTSPRLWKVSIEGTGESATRAYCFEQGEARIGWGDTGDLAADGLSSPYFLGRGSNDRNTLRSFGEEINTGDILVCIASATTIGAVGVVTGPYRFDATPPAPVRPDYKHVLPVHWLYRGIDLSVLPLNNETQFTLKTVYRLDRFGWGDLLAYLKKSGLDANDEGRTRGAQSQALPHVLIIDEINRGNVSRIFGELITLLEPSKRQGAAEALEATLPYSRRPFSVPENVYVIGTMNTADRSLASLDIALRRRFTFKEMRPRPELLNEILLEGFSLGEMLRAMNRRIEVLLDRDHCLGHAYFMPLIADRSLASLATVFQSNIIPLLQEYFFEDWQRIHWVLNDHQKAPEHQFIRGSESDTLSIFGEGVAIERHRKTWEINVGAFDLTSAYSGIIEV